MTTTETSTQVPASTPNTEGVKADWTQNLNDELKGYVENKGFKDPTAVLDSYRNLEKLMGVPKERLLRLPEKEEDPNWNEVYSKLGRPDKPDDYSIPLPEGQKDDGLAKWAKGTFHELGLTRKQAETLSKKWNDHVAKLGEAQRQQVEHSAKQQDDEIRKEWGAAFDQNVNLAKRAAATFGLNSETIDKLENAMGFAGVMKFFHNIGSKLGEDTFVSGHTRQGAFGALTPEGARSRIQALKQDQDFIKRYTSGDTQARAEFERLHEWAYGAS